MANQIKDMTMAKEERTWLEDGIRWKRYKTYDLRKEAKEQAGLLKDEGFATSIEKMPSSFLDDPYWQGQKPYILYVSISPIVCKIGDKALIGAAGEHYVAFRLVASGYAVGLAPRGTMSIDLLVANSGTGKSITIQTKTGWGAVHGSGVESWWKWPVSMSRQQPRETFFYAFVDLKNDPSQTPDVFIVPSVEVAPPLLREFPVSSWFVIEDEEDARKYRDRWDVIKDALA